MKVALFETIVMDAGHESEFDKILVDELKKSNNEVCFFAPENYPFKFDYGCEIYHLKTKAVSYANVNQIKKWLLSIAREIKKIIWLNEALNLAKQGLVDAVVIPTCSYRMLKSILLSQWTKAQTPILLILHGIMPQDRAKFVNLTKKLAQFTNIKIACLGLQDDFDELRDNLNFFTLTPPVYSPYLLNNTPQHTISRSNTLKFGFFGQYRKEKNLEFILESFCEAKFRQSVELIVQGSTPTKEDELDFKRLEQIYSKHQNIKFIHKNLIGLEWQEALMSIDVLLIPYGVKRYLYQPSAMLFTAIGFNKPVIISQNMNPQIINEFEIGEFVDLSSKEIFSRQLESFANNFDEKLSIYQTALKNANQKYSGANLINQIIGILGK